MVQILKNAGDRDVTISSFNPVELMRAAAARVTFKLGLLFGHDAGLFMRHGMSAQFFGTHLKAIHPSWKVVSPWLVEEAARHRWDVNVWTVNDPARAAWLKEEGVDSVISDVADEIAAALE